MAERQLLEDSWQFKPDRTKITESKVGSLSCTTIPGVLSQVGVVNGNKRRYRRSVWEANLKEDSELQTLIKNRQAWGELEHPENGIVNLKSPISHMVVKVSPIGEDGLLKGEIFIFEDLPEGKKLRVLIEAGWDPLVSSRGFGSVSRAADGIDEVQDDYVCQGWDVVSSPSFKNARLTPPRAAHNESTAAAPKVTEAAVLPQPPKSAPHRTNMLTQIRSTVTSLAGVNILKANARMVAESFATVASCHQQLAEHAASTPNAAYECHRLHEELEEITNNWHAEMTRLQTENAKLTADRAKLVVLSEHLAKTANLYRAQLVETVARRNASAKVFEAVAQRGRGWMKIAEKRQKTAASLEHQCRVACRAVEMLAENTVALETGKRGTVTGEALAQFAAKYHADTTKLAKKVVSLEFPAESALPEHVEKLKSARTADDVVVVRKAITESKKPATPPANTPPANTPPANTPPAPVAEGQSPSPAPGSPSPVSAKAVTESGQRSPIVGHSLDLSQCVSVVTNLAKRK